MRDDRDLLKSDWEEGTDLERSLAIASRLLQAVAAERVDPAYDPGALRAALDRHLDGPDGDPALVMQVLQRLPRAFRAREAEVTEAQRVAVRAQGLTIRATGLHRLGESRAAAALSYQALRFLEERAEGTDALMQAMSSSTPNLVAEHTVDVIAIAAAASRQAPFAASEQQRLDDGLRKLFAAYALVQRSPVTYPRTAAMAAQMFYWLAEGRDGDDAALVDVAYELDLRTRGGGRRAQATVPLREYVRARRRDDVEAASQAASAARGALVQFPLPRHARVVEQRGYLAA